MASQETPMAPVAPVDDALVFGSTMSQVVGMSQAESDDLPGDGCPSGNGYHSPLLLLVIQIQYLGLLLVEMILLSTSIKLLV